MATNLAKAGSFSAYGAEILESEAAALLLAAQQLDGSFDRAVEAILSLPPSGRLIVCGMGKTGFIGMKISASFASIGVPSFFLHPADAIHGDLGRVTNSDLMLLLSNSGETPELLRILSPLQRIGATTLAICGSNESKLAKRAHMSIGLGKIREAGPLGLAPTTSTTVMLAIGDALIMAVLNHRGISREQFALFHPGGTLGRTLMLVSEIMRRDAEHCVVEEHTTVREVIHRITVTPRRPGAASVVDSAGKLRGIFTDGDLRRCLDNMQDFLDLPVSKVMGRNPKTTTPQALAEEALRTMSEHQIDQVVVVDDSGQPVGMLDIQDLVQANRYS